MYLTLMVAPALVVGQSSIEGNWVGGTNVLGGWMLAQVSLRNEGNNLTGTIDIPAADASGLQLVNPIFSATAMKFQIPTPIGLFSFEGELKDNIISGNITNPSGAKGKLHLVHAAQIDSKVYDALGGNYETQTGLSLMVIPTSKGQLTAIRTEKSGSSTAVSQHILIPVSEQKFFTAVSVISSSAADETFTFENTADGAKKLTWQKKDGTVISAVKANRYRLEQVKFQNGAVTISGVLLSPLTRGKHPAAVIVPSSGPDTRSNTGILLRAEMLVNSGFAALIYDKRGAGDSTGDWQRASFEEQADDALAGVAFLENRKDINARQIGLMGHSQSAWIVPMAVARSKKPSFLIITSGGGTLVAEQEIYRAETQTRNAKFSEEEISEAVNLMKLKWDYALTGEDWEKYQSVAKKAQSKKWFSNIGAALDKDPKYWQFERQLKGFEPTSFIKKLQIPVLVLFGENDDTVPPKVDSVIWENSLKEAKNKDYKITILPKLGHTLLLYQEGGKPFLATEPIEIMRNWLQARFKSKRN